MTAGSGTKLAALLRSRSPLGSLVKILLGFSTWGSTESLLSWRGSATRSNRSLYRLVPLIRHKTGREFGLSGIAMANWATCRSWDWKGQTQRVWYVDDSLPNQLKASLWGTPQRSNAETEGRRDPKRKGERQILLPGQLKASLWPTAQAAQALGGQRNRGGDRKGELLLGGMLKSALWRAPGKEDTGRGPSQVEDRIAGGHAIHFADQLHTVGLTTNGCSAQTSKEAPSFAALQLAFTLWLQGYSLEYLSDFVQK